MEEHDRRSRERPEDSSGEDQSNRAILPLLQAPGNQQPHRITNFYIDNILRPDFGRRRKDGTLCREEERLGVLRTERGLQRASKTSGGVQPRGGGGGGAGGGEGGKRREGSEDSRSDREAKKAEIVAGDVPLKPLEGDGGGDQCLSSDTDSSQAGSNKSMLWPAWVYCTRYSDRPSSGPRSRKPKKTSTTTTTAATAATTTTPSNSKADDKRPRTAFTAEQLHRLKTEFQTNRYLTEQRRQSLAGELGLNESQIKIWFQNKRAKIKKATGNKNSLALHLMAQGLYNHATTSKDGDDKSDSDE